MVPTRPALGHYGLDEEGDTVRRYISRPNQKPTRNKFKPSGEYKEQIEKRESSECGSQYPLYLGLSRALTIT